MTMDEKFMFRCLELAESGLGKVAPNPMVGAVIVLDGKIIGEGFHQEFGHAHAEVNAINDALKTHPESVFEKATLYVNLEPCSHHGKTPPCCDLIIQKKFRKVVVGMQDPFSLVNGEGIRKLSNSGIDVINGVCSKEAKELNRRFITFHTDKRPYIILKFAKSLDGYISPLEPNAENRWITNSYSKKLVHKWRSEEMGIMVGTKTALIDNPELNVREWTGKDPVRIVIDRSLKLPVHLHLMNGKIRTLIINEKESRESGFNEWIQVNFKESVIPQILKILFERNIQSVIVEGGQLLLQKFIDAGIWDEARIFTGNKWLGKGKPAPLINGNVISQYTISDDTLVILRK